MQSASKTLRLFGVKCADGEPLINANAEIDGTVIGKVTAGATSPYLKCGIGIVRLDQPGLAAGSLISVGCKNGRQYSAELVEMPFYDKLAEIPRGKLTDIPERR